MLNAFSAHRSSHRVARVCRAVTAIARPVSKEWSMRPGREGELCWFICCPVFSLLFSYVTLITAHCVLAAAQTSHP